MKTETEAQKNKAVTEEAVKLFKSDAVAFEKSESAAKEAGKALRAVQKTKPERGFTQWIKDNLGGGEKIRQRVYYCIRAAYPVPQEAGTPNKQWLRISKGFRALRTAKSVKAAEVSAAKLHAAVDAELSEVKESLKA